MSYCVRLHPEEQHVVLAGTQDKKIQQWDLESGDMVQVREGGRVDRRRVRGRLERCRQAGRQVRAGRQLLAPCPALHPGPHHYTPRL